MTAAPQSPAVPTSTPGTAGHRHRWMPSDGIYLCEDCDEPGFEVPA